MRCVRALLHDRAGLACLLFLGIVLLAALLAVMPSLAAIGSSRAESSLCGTPASTSGR